MSIPLVQNNEKDSINTSIIAIKRQIERINMLLGLSNSEEIDTSEFVKKSDIVDEVTSGNMQSVTSNAVYNKVDSMLKCYTANVGTYTVGAGQALSFNIDSFVKPIPSEYIRLSFLYSIGQNYFNCDVNFTDANVAYATIRNNYTKSLTSTFYLYQIFIPQSQMIT